MRPEEIHKLLGGYATGTLTTAEQEALFAAALEDQALFDALAREQAMRDLMQDPAARSELLAALDDRPKRLLWWRPAAALALAGLAAVAVVLVRRQAPPDSAAIVAEVRPSQPLSIATAPEHVEPDAPQRAAKKATAATRRSAEPTGPVVRNYVPPQVQQTGRQQQLQQQQLPAAPFVAQQQTGAPPVQDKATLAEARKIERAAGAAAGVVGGVPGGAPPAATPPPPPAPQASIPATAADTVEFKAMDAQLEMRQASARSLFLAGSAGMVRTSTGAFSKQKAAADTAGLGLRYSVLRKTGTEFVEIDPETAQRDDTLALRFTANGNGYLSVGGAAPVALTAMRPYTTDPLPAATEEVKVVFAREPQITLAQTGGLAKEIRDRETYVVNTANTPAMGFTIALKRK